MASVAESLQDLIAGWDGLAVVSRYDREGDAWIFIALHDDTLGQASGGTRMREYPSPQDGLRDAMRLAAGMTAKWAALDFSVGGGKAVIALSRPLGNGDRERLLLSYGALVESLQGTFTTGVDMGTTPDDMVLLRKATRHVHGVDKRGLPVDPGPFTAHGVFCGQKAALDSVFGSDALEGRRVLVQGVGGVGLPLARSLAAEGAKLLINDLRPEAAEAVASDLGGEVVDGADLYSTVCDIYAPCAVGATVNETTIPLLNCRIVAGSANNQLAKREDAERIHARGILYAPDYVINGGGAMSFGLRDLGITDQDELFRRVESIGSSLAEIFAEAAERDESPLAAARRRVKRILARGR